MAISLLGGPLDGSISTGLAHMPVFIVACNLEDRPIYKRILCNKCAHEPVPYLFIGYERTIEKELEEHAFQNS